MTWTLKCNDKGYYYEYDGEECKHIFKIGFHKLLYSYSKLLRITDEPSDFEAVRNKLIYVETAIYALESIGALSKEDYKSIHDRLVDFMDDIEEVQNIMEEGE